MVEYVDWFAGVHFEIMQFFDQCDIAASPKVVSANIDKSRKYVAAELKTLVEVGLLEQPNEGLYKLSADGRAYLRGDMPAEDVPAPELE